MADGQTIAKLRLTLPPRNLIPVAIETKD